MITSALLAKIFPGTRRTLRDRFIEPLNRYCALYGIDTHARICAFLATGGIETDYLRTTIEYASGADYEGRRDLGNTQSGDGRRFKGRGFFQTTGRYNYRQVTKATSGKLGIDFEKQPEKLAEIEIAVESACIFWRDNNLSKWADKGDFFGVSGVVNRGSARKRALHYDKRLALYEKCRAAVPKDFSLLQPPSAPVVQPGAVAEPLAAPVPTDPNSVVLTPSENTTEGENARLKDFSDKYLKHCKNDSVKNIFAVIGLRAASFITGVWTFGLSGKITLILIGAGVLGFIVYALIYYRARITGWIQTIASSLIDGAQ